MTTTPEHEEALAAFATTAPAAVQPAVREAIRRRFGAAGDPLHATQVPADDWRPRTMPAEVRDRILVGNGLIRAHGWLTREEAFELFTGRAAPDQAAVRRLAEASLSAGAAGELKMVTRRGSAYNVEARIQGLLD